MNLEYKTFVPGKVIINGGYLVLNASECISIVPSCTTEIHTLKRLSENPSIKISTSFHDTATFELENHTFIVKETIPVSMQYPLGIINSFYKITDYLPSYKVDIYIRFMEALYSYHSSTMEESIKTGLGSSCAILIGIVDALLPEAVDIRIFIDICLAINHDLSPQSSGCDIISCIVGTCIYKKFDYKKLQVPKTWVLLLGSFNKSTNTRSMIDRNFDDSKWKKLNEVNSLIIQSYRKFRYDDLHNLYNQYAKTLRDIDDAIIPEQQFKIIMRSFEYNIIGCGASGSGGEDCVWCLVSKDALDDVHNMWKECFSFTILLENLNGFSQLQNVRIDNVN